MAYRKKSYESKIGSAEEKSREIIDEALKVAETKKKEALLEAKEENLKAKNELEKETRERRAEIQRYERRVLSKEENLDKKAEAMERKESSLVSREDSLKKRTAEVEELFAKEQEELEKISGTVEDVTYHNEESGFTVLLVDVDGDPVTVVGEVPEIAEGEEITATGSYKVHGTYGVQFRAELIERTLPATAGAIRKYLSSGAVKGLGPALAGRIVARFGDDTLTIIEKEPERLTEVRGISAEKARKIGEEYQRQFGIRSVMSLLASLGLPAATAIKAWRRWGAFIYRLL